MRHRAVGLPVQSQEWIGREEASKLSEENVQETGDTVTREQLSFIDCKFIDTNRVYQHLIK